MKKVKILSIIAVTFLLIFSACSIETKDTTPPANPSGVSLTPSASNLIISWVTPGDYDFDGVEITHETNTSSSRVKLSSDRNTKQAILIEQVDKEILNKFTIASVDIYGNKSSGIVKTYGMDTTPPAPVSDVTISEDDSKITISWKNPMDEDFVQTVVSVQYPEIAEELKIPVQGKAGSNSSLPLPKAKAGEYIFTLTAQDSSGNESSSVEKNFTVEQSIEPDTKAPAKPLEVTATPSTDSIKISWKNPQDTDFFSTEIKINDQDPIIISGLPNESKSYTFENLSEETEYTFELYSVNYSLKKSESEEISATTKSNQIIKTEKQTVTFSNPNANFTMIDISFTDGRTEDSIILGEDLLEVPYQTNVKPFRLAMYETSYNTWYEVLKWAESNGYTIVNKGVEGVFGDVEHENNMSPSGAEPKLVEMPVCRLTWRDVMVWCNALSEMQGLKPVYCTDPEFKTPLKDSTGAAFNDLNNYDTDPGEVDNPYVDENANGFRLPYVKEWEYAARKRLDATAISGRNVSGDETGSAIKTTATEQMNGLSFTLSTKQNEYCWQRSNSASNGPAQTYTGQDDTNATLSEKTGLSISGRRMHLSGGKLPNHLGFFDMSGNVPEWCFDYDLPYGSAYKFSTARGLRGGDHLNEIVGSRCSGNKGGSLVGLAFGFRIAQNH